MTFRQSWLQGHFDLQSEEPKVEGQGNSHATLEFKDSKSHCQEVQAELSQSGHAKTCSRVAKK